MVWTMFIPSAGHHKKNAESGFRLPAGDGIVHNPLMPHGYTPE